MRFDAPSTSKHCAVRRVLVLLLPVAFLTTVASGQSSDRYWIFFENKLVQSVELPEQKTRVLESAERRRALRGKTDADWLDRPVSPTYLNRLAESGVEPVVTSRWLNAVSARLTQRQLRSVKRLPFVRSVRRVGAVRTSADKVEPAPALMQSALPATTSPTANLDYGPSRQQLDIVNAIPPIERGIIGSGVRLGFIDTEYDNLDHPVFDRLHADGRLVAQQNFTGQSQTSGVWWHGFAVASVAVGFLEGSLIGPAYGADVLLATTEVVSSETTLEEDYFVEGLEWLEASGVDVVNVSLGYFTFDSAEDSYTHADLDGDTGVTTVAADIAVSLGVVVVTSAGNEGLCGNPDECWYYVATPADGHNVITVGGVTPSGSRYLPGSYGPTADGRIKPDVAAMAEGVYFAIPNSNSVGFGGGTSFASPMVAGVVCQMLQVNPALTPEEVASLLRASGSQSDNPDNSLGWGVIDAEQAVLAAEAIANSIERPESLQMTASAYPIPMRNSVAVEISMPVPVHEAKIVVYDILGRTVLSSTTRSLSTGVNRVDLDTSMLPPGPYFYTITGADLYVRGNLLKGGR